ncbi:zinc-dependent peptidase [uncultured Winogradskyella sp.]|uniref:zinc-dependent peptidase n=1 Tax=uncultured Winogradskyella sp. TaxID=395353 RepID=UPI0026371FA4|nr:zinc-dependent peptidase [uncultured Winogradskyella sp.]
MLLQTQQEIFERELMSNYVIPIGVVLITLFIMYRVFRAILFFYASRFRKPLYNHVYFGLKRLTKSQQTILKNELFFYNKLSDKERIYFQHRLAKLFDNTEFVGRDQLKIDDHMKILILGTLVMITFGFRNYRIDLVNKILLYPKAFYSNTNQNLHKGEFNPSYKAIVFSWEDVLLGYSIENDNFNLAIHEIVHALHLDCLKNKGFRAAIFLNGFTDIVNFLESNKAYRQRLIESEYFRDYAYTNQYEFLSVIIETFIETPNEFRGQFPELYNYVKTMLNFNFAGY